ncbi:MAG: outer membrane beta-barrel protein [Alphaproteobacteria bacterium]|nr:MAG: outer membrane beta-barrel protein [Alphaproteobacteria bacterium]
MPFFVIPLLSINSKKLRIFALTLCALSLSTVSAQAFHGPFAGVQVGYSQSKPTLSHTLGKLSGTTKPTLTNWLLGGHGGYGRTFDNKFYLGTELFVTYDGLGDVTKDYVLTQGTSRTATVAKIGRSYSFGADLRLGFQFEAGGSEMLIYTGPTFQFSQWTARGTTITEGSQINAKESLLMGFGGNLGYEIRLKREVSVGFVGKYIRFKDAKFLHLKVASSAFSGSVYFNIHM